MKLNEILGTEFPIIQGGMANIATGEFAATCSNAGALGMIATGGWDADRLRREIRRARELTGKPFGVNLMLMNPCADEMARVIVEEGVQVVTTGAGNPGKYIPAWKEAGIKESGGHVGEMTTMALVPQVIDAVDVPVVAAGGIASGRQMAAALALGACGVQVGTCLLASRECPIHENYKQAVLKAKDSDTVVTGRSVGGPVRCLKNRMTREYLALEKRGATLEELETVTLGGLRRAVFDGDMDTGSVMAGQVAGMLREIRPLRQIFEELCGQGRAVLAETGREWGAEA